MTPRSERFNGQPAVFANLAAASNKSRLHGELVPVLGEIKLLADCVQGRRHLRKSSGGRVLTLMPYPNYGDAPAGLRFRHFTMTHLIICWVSKFISNYYWQNTRVLHDRPLDQSRQLFPRRPFSAHRVNMSIFPNSSISSIPELQAEQQKLASHPGRPVHLGCANSWTLPQLVTPTRKACEPGSRTSLTHPSPSD